MEEVRPEELVEGEDYYIEMVGAFNNEHRLAGQSGKAIGKGFIKTITMQQILNEHGDRALTCGIGIDCFNFSDIFVQFRKVVPVNPGKRECGICHYRFYPATRDSFNTLTDQQQKASCGGYKFFKMNKKEIEKEKAREVARRTMEKGVGEVASEKTVPGLQKYLASFMAGGKYERKRRRKTNRKTRRKTRKTKRKSRKRIRKRKTKKRR